MELKVQKLEQIANILTQNYESGFKGAVIDFNEQITILTKNVDHKADKIDVKKLLPQIYELQDKGEHVDVAIK